MQEMMDKAGPDMKEIYREKLPDAKRIEESMRNEETIKHELEKVRDILSEANEQLAGNKGRLLLVLLSYHKVGCIILSEAHEQLAGNKGRLLLVLLSYHKVGCSILSEANEQLAGNKGRLILLLSCHKVGYNV